MGVLTCPVCSTDLPPGGRFCPACGAALPLPGEEITRPYQPLAEPNEAGCRLAAPSAGNDRPRFLPGDVVAARYRIVVALGKGGMGEVYRADDLTLGQTVALKFLPRQLAQDAGPLARLRHEVRIARQVSHPNVCRVYDLGEADGQLFLTMEYIEGEDLAALLKKVGRLPEDRGIELARQLCLGLAAVHAKGVIHRDLKPHNVMLDGRGQVRLTDFGLAGFAGEFHARELRSGTPAYMAPEQLAGREVSVQSDLFSLGLILYESFTGKRAYAAQGGEELKRRLAEEVPPRPSIHVAFLDSAVERVILRCLEKDPKDRPRSALGVLAELPGGDPLQAALAAGQTPAPEIVANAGGEGTLAPRSALLALAGILLSLALYVLLADKTTMVGQVRLQEPAVLAHQSRAVLRELEWAAPENPAAATAFAFRYDAEVFQRQHPDTGSYGMALQFWYRQSPQRLAPALKLENRVSLTDPPANVPGMASVVLDPHGRLLAFEAVPPRLEPPGTPPGVAPSTWRPTLAKLTGLDLASFEVAESTRVPAVYADHRLAWVPRAGSAEAALIERVEAAFYRGRPVAVSVIRPGARLVSVSPFTYGFGVGEADLVLGLQMLVIFLAAALLAWRNLRLSRGDVRGATRLALFVLATDMLSWLLGGSHVLGIEQRWLFQDSLGRNLFWASYLWLVYLALESYVRRFWPSAFISWSRLLAGRLSDPLVGHHVLLGMLGGVVIQLLWQLRVLGSVWVGLAADRPIPTNLTTLLGVSDLAGQLLLIPVYGIEYGLGVLGFLFLLRLLLRRERWTAGVFVLVNTVVFYLLGGSGTWLSWCNAFLGTLVVTVLALRFGLLALAALYATTTTLLAFPFTADGSTWYAGRGFFVAALVAAGAVGACYTSRGGRSMGNAFWATRAQRSRPV